MGKKSLAKKQRQQAKQSAKATVKPTVGMPVTSIVSATNLGNRLATQPGKAAAVADYSYVRSDIKRILMFLLVVIVLLVTAVIVNSRTTLLNRAGSKVAHFLQLQ